MTSDAPVSPAVRKALRYLTQLVASFGEEADPVLPSIAKLSSMAGVSLVTMWKATGILKRQGILAGSRGHSLYVPRELPQAPAHHGTQRPEVAYPGSADRSWRVVRSRIEGDLLGNIFARGRRLPSQKELIGRYGTSFRTLSAALRSLVADRILIPQGRGYIARTYGRLHGRPRVCLLGLASESGEFLMGDIDRAIMYSLEAECTRCGIDLDIIAFVTRENAGLTFFNVQHALETMQLRDRPETLGYMLLAIHPDSAPASLLQRLRSFGKPVAVLDELGEYYLPPSFRDSSLVRFFTMTASAMPGRIAGRFCIAKGHARAAYISPYHRYFFSKQRYRGLHETFRSAGTGFGAIAFTHAELGMPELTSRSRQQADTAWLRERYLEWRTTIPAIYARTFDRRIDELGALTLLQAAVASYANDLFENALRDAKITAWVVVNDLLAGMSLDFLNQRNIRVPKEIAVMGFDNTFEGLKRGITSYDFNINAVAGAMLQYIIRPRSFTAFRSRRIIELEGAVVDRRTS